MIQRRYSTALQPAAPIIDVLLGNPNVPPPAYTVQAQRDTGADRTVIPLAAASGLRLRFLSNRQAGVAGGSLVVIPIYEVTIRIPGVMDFVIEAAALSGEPRVLLGRDVLSCLYTTLNGPDRILELSAQPPAAPTL